MSKNFPTGRELDKQLAIAKKLEEKIALASGVDVNAVHCNGCNRDFYPLLDDLVIGETRCPICYKLINL